MGDLTKNFSRKEFACKCECGFDTIDYEVLNAVQHCADRLENSTKKKVTVTVNSGCRCKKYNDDLRKEYDESGGKKGEKTSKNSLHIYGRAVDVEYFAGGVKVDPKEIANFFDKNYPRFGIGTYNSFTHIDSRTNGPARWHG